MKKINYYFNSYYENYEIRKQFDNGRFLFIFPILFIISLTLTLSLFFLIIKLYVNLKLKSIKKKSNTASFIFSENQKSIHSIISQNGVSSDVFFISTDIVEPKIINARFITNKFIILNSISNSPLVLLTLLKSIGNIVLRNNLIRVYKLIGLKNIFNSIIENYNNVIQYNDHSPYNILLSDTCFNKNVKSFYFQHAPINEKFPSLHHDVNILFSQHSIDMYRNPSNKKIIPFFDIRFVLGQEYKVNGASFKNTILVCTNKLDDKTKIEGLLNELVKSFKVILRPHPSDDRKIKVPESVKTSPGSSIWEDLKKSDFMITNESAVVLEALYLDVKVYKYTNLSSNLDNYGFYKNGLITKEYSTIKDLIDGIFKKEISTNIDVLKYYIGEIDNIKGKMNLIKNEL